MYLDRQVGQLKFVVLNYVMIEFSRDGDVSPTPIPQPGESEYLSLSGASL